MSREIMEPLEGIRVLTNKLSWTAHKVDHHMIKLCCDLNELNCNVRVDFQTEDYNFFWGKGAKKKSDSQPVWNLYWIDSGGCEHIYYNRHSATQLLPNWPMRVRKDFLANFQGFIEAVESRLEEIIEHNEDALSVIEAMMPDED